MSEIGTKLTLSIITFLMGLGLSRYFSISNSKKFLVISAARLTVEVSSTGYTASSRVLLSMLNSLMLNWYLTVRDCYTVKEI